MAAVHATISPTSRLGRIGDGCFFGELALMRLDMGLQVLCLLFSQLFLFLSGKNRSMCLSLGRSQIPSTMLSMQLSSCTQQPMGLRG
eukprot:SAG11_NODE_260_length_11531_cov_6.271781_8_plen_87_part_00